MNEPSYQDLQKRILELQNESLQGKRIEAELLEKQAALRAQNISIVRKSIELSDIKRELEDKNYDLEQSRSDLEKAMRALRKARDQLELRVEKRTAQLREANEQLKQEILERQEAEEELLRIMKAVESASDAIGMSDPKGHHFYQNRAFTDLFEYTAEELEAAGGGPAAYVDPAVARDVFNKIMSGQSWVGKTEMVSRSGRRFSVFSRADAVKDDFGNIIGLIGVHTDMTERERAQEEKERLEAKLQQAQKLEAIGTLAGGIAHDFNNLLMGIQGNVSLTLMDTSPTHPHYEKFRSIEKQVKSGARLTSQLLGYARKGRYEVKPVDLNAVVQETSEAFGRTKKEVTIHRDLADHLSTTAADQGQIEQVLWNLFVNAADAMPGGGRLILKTVNINHKDMKGKLYDPKPGDYVLLTVTDTGTGMDEQTLDRIFEPFFTTKETGQGTGLGLASVYGIIKGHGGYVDVESRKGHGSTFSIYLPASDKEVLKAVEPTVRLPKTTGTVLLVDDEDIILQVGKDLLELMGYRVLTAGNGQEAVEVYGKNRDVIDLVVLDMVMPTMGGGEAYDRMKDINPKIKALLSTGYSIEGEATEILERGCNGFIQKPFNMDELSEKIREILDKE
jgi:two-component system cell cycle sensor histidine kinase/response regulator CckA